MIRNSSAALLSLLLAGCGGGGSDSPTQVSASPDAPAATPAPATSPPPVAAVPTPTAPPIASPAPVQTPASPPVAQPPGVESPAQPPAETPAQPPVAETPVAQPPAASPPAASPPAVPSPVAPPLVVPPPVQTPPPAAQLPLPTPVIQPPSADLTAVDGAEIERAIRYGVPLIAEFPSNGAGGPSAIAGWQQTHTRRVKADNKSILLFATGDLILAGEEPIMDPSLVRPVSPRQAAMFRELVGSSVNVKTGNGVTFPAYYAPLTGSIPLNRTLAEWKNGDWFVKLIPSRSDRGLDYLRICWHINLPDHGIRSPIDSRAWVRLPGAPLLRLQCSDHRRTDGVDVGGYVLDDVAGVVTTYRGNW